MTQDTDSGMFQYYDDVPDNWECDHCGATYKVRGKPTGCPECHRHSLSQLHDEPIGRVV